MPDTQRKSTSLALKPELLEEARALGVTVSRAAEDWIAQAVRAARARAWQDEHAAAVAAYDAFIADHGVPLARDRKF